MIKHAFFHADNKWIKANWLCCIFFFFFIYSQSMSLLTCGFALILMFCWVISTTLAIQIFVFIVIFCFVFFNLEMMKKKKCVQLWSVKHLYSAILHQKNRYVIHIHVLSCLWFQTSHLFYMLLFNSAMFSHLFLLTSVNMLVPTQHVVL